MRRWIGLVKLVLDTNVLVSALLTKGTPPDQLYQAWKAHRFALAISTWQISELRRVLSYKKLQPYLNGFEASLLLENIDSLAQTVEVSAPRTESPDPDDNWILASAVESQADLLVTGDKNDLLQLKQIEEIQILNARKALSKISGAG
ncbi:MAG: putative toxin-antitoxin system toxin component, PIN family [Puniceicoccaceae bacterium]|nr:MAG: putative toxin-antitoxin system toxin component, PIN family [Puniceicoccaceae bacterium]